MVFQNDILAGASGSGGSYQIDQSIRFNDDDSAYMSRTPGTNANGGVWTFSEWVKRGVLGTALTIISDGATSFTTTVRFTVGDNLYVDVANQSSTGYTVTTDAVFRDPSAWYHIVVAVNTSDATSSDRVKVWVNGVRQTLAGTYPSTAFGGGFSTSFPWRLGDNSSASHAYYDGYMAEINFIDGQALAPTDFGETNDDGVWVPKAYEGTYGTNGFYITGEDSAALGTDYSGNGNDFTSSGLTSDDQVIDTPTDNYATWSAIQPNAGTLANGSLQITALNSKTAVSTFRMDSGKWIASAKSSAGSSQAIFGLWQDMGTVPPASDPGFNVNSWAWYIAVTTSNRGVWTNSAKLFTVATLDNTYDMLVAVDIDAGKMWFGTDIGGTTVWYNSSGGTTGDPATGANPTATFTAGSPMYFAGQASVNTITANFGQSSFAYTPPTGFKFLSTANLPAPAIKDGSKYFQTTLYTGNGTAIGSGGNAVTQIGNSTFQPDFVWIKGRSGTTSHLLFDAVRGATKYLSSDGTYVENTGVQSLSTFDTDGFTLGNQAGVNTNAATYAGWQWLAANGTASNTDGSITSTVSANTTAGFSVVTATAGASGVYSYGHGLGVKPSMFIVKNIDAVQNWQIWNKNLTSETTSYLQFTTSAQLTFANMWGAAPTSTTFSMHTAGPVVAGDNFVAYCFAEVEGFSKFGSYTGNGSADGPFVWCGFRPAWVMLKAGRFYRELVYV
jgi:hypothetical protein